MFKTIQDVVDCKIDTANVTLMRFGNSERYWKNRIYTVENIRKCSKNAQWTGDAPRASLIEDVFNRIRKKQSMYYFGEAGSIINGAQRHCETFISVGGEFMSSQVAFFVSKKFNRTVFKELNRATQILSEQRKLLSAKIIAHRNRYCVVRDFDMTVGRLAGAFLSIFILGLLFFSMKIWYLWNNGWDDHRDRVLASNLRKSRSMLQLSSLSVPGNKLACCRRHHFLLEARPIL